MKRLLACIMASLLFLLIYWGNPSPAVAQTKTIADSVSDFSGSQGEKNWYYGYDKVGSTVDFAIAPGVNAFNDKSTLTAQISYTSPQGTGAIAGLKWNDLNGNGQRDSKLIKGDNPDVVFVIDLSRSTIQRKFAGSDIGDVNGTEGPNTILDAELAGFIELNQQLIDQGLGNTAEVGIVVFAWKGWVVDMDPSTDGKQFITTAGADKDGNGKLDVVEAIASIQGNNKSSKYPYITNVNGQQIDIGKTTNFEEALQAAEEIFAKAGTESGQGNLIFLSDGKPSTYKKNPQKYDDEVSRLQAKGVNISAFGAGTGASLEALQDLDTDAEIFTTTDELIEIFSGLKGPSQSFSESPMSGVTLYLDLNNNGSLDSGEPSVVSDEKGRYKFEQLQPGTYIVREVVPDGSVQSFPDKFHEVTVGDGETVEKINFGNAPAPEPATGSIAGLKWDDLNGNGVQDSKLLKGFPPDAVFVVDLSGSTILATFQGTPVGDVNNTGQANTILDAELAGFMALNQQLIDINAGNKSKVGIVVFGQRALPVDMDPVTPGMQLLTTPLADKNGNGVSDVKDALTSIQAFNPNYVRGQGPYIVRIAGQNVNTGPGTNFEPPLQLAENTARAIGTENVNVIFLSDGNPGGGQGGAIYQQLQTNYVDEAQRLKNANVNVIAFGVGQGASLPALQRIDPDAEIFSTTDEIIDIFSGSKKGDSSSSSRGELEPIISDVTVYLDLNQNGSLDPGEPTQVTDANGQYKFTKLEAGSYVVREVVPSGYRQTFPQDAHQINLSADEKAENINFGNSK